MSERDPVESVIREALDKWSVGQAAAVAAHLRAAGLLRDEAEIAARERQAREQALRELIDAIEAGKDAFRQEVWVIEDFDADEIIAMAKALIEKEAAP